MPEQVSCKHFEGLAVLYALGELEAPLRAAAEEHARACPTCAALLQREAALAEILASGAGAEQEPSDFLLASCRSRLNRTIDTAAGRARPRAWTTLFSLRDWIAAFRISPRVHPAWSAATLLLIGAFAGLAGWEGIGRDPLRQWGPTAMTVLAAPPPAPVAPAHENATQQPAAQAQHPTPAVTQDSEVYSATDAGMSDAPSAGSFDPGPVADPAQQQTAHALRLDGEAMPFGWGNAPPPRQRPARSPSAVWEAPDMGRLAELSHRMESLWWGGVRIDPAEQQQRLVRAPSPEYPEVARRAGIEGPVTLLLRIAPDGSVEDSQLLSGEPVLGRAAAEAVEQWHYSPLRIGGRPVSILTSVTFDFELR